MALLIVATIIWLAFLVFLRFNRIWVFYFIVGAVGFTLLAILYLRGSPVEYALEHWTGLILYETLKLFGIQSLYFDNAPGTILMLIEMEQSWTVIDIDIECSGLLESSVFLGLVFFYPAFSLSKKIIYALSGALAIFMINLIRLYTIIFLIVNEGRDTIYIAHTLVGRLVFFGLIIILYWRVFTRSALIKIREFMKNV